MAGALLQVPNYLPDQEAWRAVVAVGYDRAESAEVLCGRRAFLCLGLRKRFYKTTRRKLCSSIKTALLYLADPDSLEGC